MGFFHEAFLYQVNLLGIKKESLKLDSLFCIIIIIVLV